MEDKILLAELTKNCEGKKQKLNDLLTTFEMACLGYDMQEQHSKDIHNRVLQENEFFAVHDCGRGSNIHVGDRITDEDFLFLLSEEDVDRVFELCRPICVAEKLTDEKGYYLENWVKMRSDARKELVNFVISEIIPENLRPLFDKCRWNVVYSDKLINIVKGMFKEAA